MEKRRSFFRRIVDAMFQAKGWRRRSLYAFLFLVSVMPGLLMFAFGYADISKSFHMRMESERRSLAYLSASLVKERLDGLKNLGISYAKRIRFREDIAAGKWESAMRQAASIPDDMPIVDGVFLMDVQGTLRATTPEIPGAVGKNFAFREYFLALQERWEPYVSDVFMRTLEPRYNVVVLSIPVSDDQGGKMAVFGMYVRIDKFASWIKDVDAGTNGFAFLTDRKGQLVFHPKYQTKDKIVSFANVSAVQELLRGKGGVGIGGNTLDDKRYFSAWEPVSGYGWGVVVSQPDADAHADYRRNILRFSFQSGLVLFFSGFFLIILLKILAMANRNRQKEAALLESIGDGVIVIDRNFHINSFNRVAEELTGWRREEAMKKHLFDVAHFVHEADGKPNVTFIEEAMLFGQSKVMENRTVLARKDGQTIPVGDTAAPVFDQDGNVNGAIIVFRNIAHERELERMQSIHAAELERKVEERTAALKDLEERHFSFLNSTPTIAWMKDADGRYLFANRAMQEVFKRLPDEWIGKTDADFLPKDIAEQLRKNEMGAMKTHRVTESLERVPLPDAGMRDWQVHTFSFNDSKGKIYVGGFAHDVTEEKRSKERMGLLDSLKNTFVKIVSHQLRTPLNAIRWNLEALLAGDLGKLKKNQEEFVRSTYEAELEIGKRIRQLLTSMDIEEGRIFMEKDKIDFKSLCASVWSVFHKKCKVKDLTCEHVMAEKPLPSIAADAEKIRESLEVFLDNALTYTPRGGKIRCAMTERDGWLRFEVADTGIGIPQAEQGKIFQRFFRGSNAQAMKTDASGLGLFIAKYFIEQHGGTIGFTSEEGKGSVFWFEIPIMTQ